MGGDLWVDSKPDIGSTFCFTVPLEADETQVPSTANISMNFTCGALIISNNYSITLELISHLCTWNIPVTHHQLLPQFSDLSTDDYRSFDFIFYDFTRCNRCVQLSDILSTTLIKHHENSEPNNNNSIMKTDTPPVIVSVVSVGDLKFKDLPVLQIPIKRETLRRLLFGNVQKRTKMTDSWEDFAQCHPLKILVVDDNEINIQVTIRMLNRMGYRNIDFAKNGAEAVKLVSSRSYDLIFMDIHMPVLGGIEATKQIREYNQSVFICALSAEANIDFRDKGMDQTLLKPLSIDSLFEVVQECSFQLSSKLS